MGKRKVADAMATRRSCKLGNEFGRNVSSSTSKFGTILAMVTVTSMILRVVTADPASDKLVLQSFKAGITNSDVLGWTGTDPCLWTGESPAPGVQCDSAGNVVQLRVREQGLKGTVTPDINLLTSLNYLEINLNNFTGAMPSLSGLSKLAQANLGNNDFSSIPSDFFDGLTSIVGLYINDNPNLNASSGGWAMPASMTDAASTLTTFYMNSVNAMGSVPSYFGTMPALQVLRMGYNSFSGDVPETIASSGIQELRLNNQAGGGFTGSVEFIGSMIGSTLLYLHGNSFKGPVPDGITKAVGLTDLRLSGNQLVGRVPLGLSSMRALKTVWLGDGNTFSGELPELPADSVVDKTTFCAAAGVACSTQVDALLDFLAAVGYPQAIATVWVGADPCSWTGIACDATTGEVTSIMLNAASLNGTISPSLAELTSLEYLSLTRNSLTGAIPTKLTGLKSLKTVDVSNNNLSPPLPKFSSSVTFTYTGNSLLIGGVPPATPPVATPPVLPPATPPVLPPAPPPVATPPVLPPATPPVLPPATPPVLPPATPPVLPPATPPVLPPATPPVLPPATPPVLPPATPPVLPPATPPVLPPATPPVLPPATPPVLPPATPPVLPPVTPPVLPPVLPPATPPVLPPATPPVLPPATPPVLPPATPPVLPPATPPVLPPATPPVLPPATPPVLPPATPPVLPPATPPVLPPATPPVLPPATPPVLPPATPPVLPPAPPPVATPPTLPPGPAPSPTVPVPAPSPAPTISAPAPSPIAPSPGIEPPGQSPAPTPTSVLSPSKKSSNILPVVIGGAVGGVALCLLLLALCCCYKRKIDRRNAAAKNRNRSEVFPGITPASSTDLLNIVVHNRSSSNAAFNLDGMGSNSWSKAYTIDELRTVTNNFAERNILGRGGFGVVYKGFLPDGTKIAVKRMEAAVVSSKGLSEFQSEIEVLTKVKHRHLVGLLGYCTDGIERLLVYEYMSQGTLSQHLFQYEEIHAEPLSWTQRLTIALDVAQAVEYLHSLAHRSFIHRDLKPSNILLNDDFRAKVSDFGLVKLAPEGNLYSLETRLAGTFGYLAPEYAVTGRVTTKSDVFSFGVVLMELLTGRRAVDETQEEQDMHLVTWFTTKLRSKSDLLLRESLDPNICPDLADDSAFHSIVTVAELAGHCTTHMASQRPDMGHAVSVLRPLVDMWKPKEDYNEGYSMRHMSLTNALKQWQEFRDESMSAVTDNSTVSVPTRPGGFANSFTSADGR